MMPTRNRSNAFWFVALLLILCIDFANGETTAELIAKLPPTTNMLLVVDFRHFSEASHTVESLGRADLLPVPPGSEIVVLGAELDFAYLSPAWQVVFLSLEPAYTLKPGAGLQGDNIETIAGRTLTHMDRRRFATVLDERTIAIIGPVSRQAAARWVRQDWDRSTGHASEFLRFAGHLVDTEQAMIVLAFDFRDTLSPLMMRRILASNELIPKDQVDPLANVLAGLEGGVLTVKASDGFVGRLQLRFADDIEPLRTVAPQLASNILQRFGAEIPELESWESSAEKGVLSLQGQLTDNGLQRVTHLASLNSLTLAQMRRFARDLQENFAYRDRDDIEPSPGSPVTGARTEIRGPEAATLGHFRRMLRALNAAQRRSEKSTWFQTRIWLDRTASHIEELDRTTVDTDVLAVSDSIVLRLREMASLLQDAASTVATTIDQSNWITMPQVDYINYGGIRYARPLLYYSGTDAQFANLVHADAAIREATIQVRTIGITIVRDVNELREQLEARYQIKLEPWQPTAF